MRGRPTVGTRERSTPMPQTRSAVLSAIRGGALGVALFALLWIDRFTMSGLHADLARGIVVLFAIGACLPRGALVRPAVPLLLLAADLVASATAGVFLKSTSVTSFDAASSLPFLAGFLVAALVAVTGRRMGAAGLGALAGTMLLVLGESTLPGVSGMRGVVDAPEFGPLDGREIVLLLRLGLLTTVAIECATVMGWIDADIRRRRTAEAIERERRARDSIASEMATCLSAASAAGSLHDLADALIQHLRRHFPTRARAVALEDGIEKIYRWEEAGTLDDDVVEQRRLRLQDALREAGSNTLIDRLETRSTSGREISRTERFATAVGVGVHSVGRVCGVIFVADPRRGALAEDRIGALAELARQTGEAVRRLDRSRGEQTRRTALLLGQMHEGVLLLGPDGRVLLSNPAGREMLKTLGQSPDAPVALGEGKPQEIAGIAAGKVRRWSITGASEGGKSLRFMAAAVGVIDAGARLGTLVTLTDVTEEEQTRRRLLHAEKLSVVGQTLASVAHELNNPLAAIVGYADLLAESHVTPEVERLLLRIREQATRTSRIVKNLLSVARRRGPERTRVTLNEVVTSVIDLFAYDARLNNVLILPSLAPDLPGVMGDRHALQQVLVNLVQNALHALRGRTGGGRIEIRTSVDRGMAVVSVRDDGPGISPENRAKIFEAFFTTKGPDEGTGLGLAISRGIAREHGGDLALEMPHEGPGAQFVMRIPIEQGEAAPKPERSAIPDGVPAHVLVVDDEAPVRESLVAQLGRLGAQVDSAATPLEASRLLGGPAPYDAVLMDVRLPGQSGLDVHRALRARNPVLAQRVVFMTGDLVNEELLRELKETGNQVLEKPFTSEELRQALSRAGGRTPQT